MTYLIASLATTVAFIVCDLVWLGWIAGGYYRNALGPLMAAEINLPAAAAFYVLYVLGVVIFAVAPAIETGGWPRAMGLGAMLGLFAYATYDLTNLATLQGFPLRLALVDMAWGTLLTAGAAAAGAWAASNFNP
jgi:uncharacterized membrane protein